MNWFGDSELQCCVMGDGDTYVIFAAAEDGTLTILGDAWKQRKRRSRLPDQAMAMRVAEAIAASLNLPPPPPSPATPASPAT